MAKLQIDSVDVEEIAGHRDRITTQVVTDEGAQSLKMACHCLPAGTSWFVSGDTVSHVCYVWQGRLEIGGQSLVTGSAVAVELGGAIELVALEDTLLVDFFERVPNDSVKHGGHVHVLPREEVRGGEDGMELGHHSLYFDANCPNCDVWLHESLFNPEREIMRHYHTEDEIIFLISGEMHLGRDVLKPGTALAIAANTPYKFTAGPEGVGFVNFRPGSPTIVLFFDGEESEVLDEAQALKDIAAGVPYSPKDS
jgi:hypothetical protein